MNVLHLAVSLDPSNYRWGPSVPRPQPRLGTKGSRRIPKELLTRLAGEVAARHRLRIEHLFLPTQRPSIAHPRQELMALLRAEGYSFPQIGLACGGRDHTTVMHGVKAHNARQA